MWTQPWPARPAWHKSPSTSSKTYLVKLSVLFISRTSFWFQLPDAHIDWLELQTSVSVCVTSASSWTLNAVMTVWLESGKKKKKKFLIFVAWNLTGDQSSAISLKISSSVKITEDELLWLAWQISHLITSRERLPNLTISIFNRCVNCQKRYCGDSVVAGGKSNAEVSHEESENIFSFN